MTESQRYHLQNAIEWMNGLRVMVKMTENPHTIEMFDNAYSEIVTVLMREENQ